MRTVIQIIEAGKVKRTDPKLVGLLTDPADAIAILAEALRVLEGFKKSGACAGRGGVAKEKASLEALRTWGNSMPNPLRNPRWSWAQIQYAKQMGDAVFGQRSCRPS